MALRRLQGDILYPFAPSASAQRASLLWLLDAFFDVASSVPTVSDTWSSTYGSRGGALVSIAKAGGNYTATFILVASGAHRRLTFVFPVTASGLLGVGAEESDDCRITVDLSRMPSISSELTFSPPAELEPCRILQRLDGVSSIKLYNEYRQHDPTLRANLDSTLFQTVTTGELNLEDGYNCALEYEESSGTLWVDIGSGLGLGLPAALPWDSSAPDIDSGIYSVNGIGGDVPLTFLDSVYFNGSRGILNILLKGPDSGA